MLLTGVLLMRSSRFTIYCACSLIPQGLGIARNGISVGVCLVMTLSIRIRRCEISAIDDLDKTVSLLNDCKHCKVVCEGLLVECFFLMLMRNSAGFSDVLLADATH